MSITIFRASLMTIFAVLFSLVAYAEKDPWPATTADGLKRIYMPHFAVAYVKPGANPKDYSQLMIQKPIVSFMKNKVGDEKWATDNLSGLPAPEEILKVRNQISEKFHEILTKKMVAEGYHLVDKPARGVLLLRPALINLKLITPETQGTGKITLYLEIFNSVTRERLAEGWDTKKDQVANNGLKDWALDANREMGQKAFNAWAETMAKGLVRMNEHAIPFEPGVAYF